MLTEEQILWDVVEEHLDEAEFLSEQWSHARRSPLYRLDELSDGPEARWRAHSAGLGLNGPLALQRVAWPVLEQDHSHHRVTAAALAIIDSGDRTLVDRLAELLDPIEPPNPADPGSWLDCERPRGLALALALASEPQFNHTILDGLGRAHGRTLALLVGACADRGLDPGDALAPMLQSDDPTVVEAALRAVCIPAHRSRYLAFVESYLLHPIPRVQQAALPTALRWNSPAGWDSINQQIDRPQLIDPNILAWWACTRERSATHALTQHLNDPQARPAVLWALGFAGWPEALEACVPFLDDDDPHCRLAGEAVASILGLDLDDDALWQPDPTDDPAVAGDTPDDDDDDLDAHLGIDPIDELPRPVPEAHRAAWEARRGSLDPGSRYQLGESVDPGGFIPRLAQVSCRRIDAFAHAMITRANGDGHWSRWAGGATHLAQARALKQR